MESPSYLLIMAFFCASVNPRSMTFTKLSRTFQSCSGYIRTAVQKNATKTKIEKRDLPLLYFPFQLTRLSLNCHNCTAVVCATSLAGSVRKYGLAALGALGNIGKVELPMCAASLVSSLSGYFTLRYCHDFRLLAISSHLLFIIINKITEIKNYFLSSSASLASLGSISLRLHPHSPSLRS